MYIYRFSKTFDVVSNKKKTIIYTKIIYVRRTLYV